MRKFALFPGRFSIEPPCLGMMRKHFIRLVIEKEGVLLSCELRMGVLLQPIVIFE
jgi:hypothetical protein